MRVKSQRMSPVSHFSRGGMSVVLWRPLGIKFDIPKLHRVRGRGAQRGLLNPVIFDEIEELLFSNSAADALAVYLFESVYALAQPRLESAIEGLSRLVFALLNPESLMLARVSSLEYPVSGTSQND